MTVCLASLPFIHDDVPPKKIYFFKFNFIVVNIEN